LGSGVPSLLFLSDDQQPSSQSIRLTAQRTEKVFNHESARREEPSKFGYGVERISCRAGLNRTSANERVIDVEPALSDIVFGFAEMKQIAEPVPSLSR
jgi:hypothetical protein